MSTQNMRIPGDAQIYAAACTAWRYTEKSQPQRGVKAMIFVATDYDDAERQAAAEVLGEHGSMQPADGWRGHQYHVVRYDLEVEPGVFAAMLGMRKESTK